MQPRRLVRGLGLAAVLVTLLTVAPLATGPRLGHAASNDDIDWVRIDWPTDGAEIGGVVEVRGRAATTDPADFDYYRLYVGRGRAARQLRPLGSPMTAPINGGIIARFDASALDPGEVTLVIRVYGKDGDIDEATVGVVVKGGSTSAGQVTAPLTVPAPALLPPGLADPAALPDQEPVLVDLPPVLVPVQLDPVGPVSPIQQLNPDPNPLDTTPNDPVQRDPRTDHIDLQPGLSEPITINTDPIPVSGGGGGSGGGD